MQRRRANYAVRLIGTACFAGATAHLALAQTAPSLPGTPAIGDSRAVGAPGGSGSNALLPQLRLADPGADSLPKSEGRGIDGSARGGRALSEDTGDATDGEAALGAEAEGSDRPGAAGRPAARAPADFDLFEPAAQRASARVRPSMPVPPAPPELASAPTATGSSAAASVGTASSAGPFASDPVQPDDPVVEVPVATGTVATGAASPAARPLGRIEDARPDLFGRTNVRAPSLRNPLPSTDPDDPFAAVGLHAGSFILFPTILQTFGASTNIDAVPDATDGTFSETTLSARLLSDWSRHEAEMNASATYRRNFDGAVDEDPRFETDGRVRLDLGHRLSATLRGALTYSRDDPTESNEIIDAEGRPEILNGSAAADLERSFGRLALRGTASVARSTKTATLAGTPDENYTTYTGAVRAGYEISPALQPFVEASLGRRLFDEAPVPGGEKPDSTLSAARAGLAFRISEKLFGEAALGYGWNDPDADVFATMRAPTLDALLTWSPRRGTDLTLAAATRFEPSSDGLSSETAYETSLGLSHRLRTRTDVNALVSVKHTDSSLAEDDETLFALETGVNYWLNRASAVTALYRHETLAAGRPAGGYDADTIQIGVRLQR